MREYTIDKLFALRWEDLNMAQIVKMIHLSEALLKHDKDSTEYGLLAIEILRTLRKDRSAVAKIDVAQAVDCFNDITFFQRDADGAFKTPWLFFPAGGFNINGFEFIRPSMNGSLPMYDRTFSQLCFADSSFSAFCLFSSRLAKEGDVLSYVERKELSRDIEEVLNTLVAVLYTDSQDFDEKDIEVRSRQVPLKMNMENRAIVLHTYANVRTFITNREYNLFPKSNSENTEVQYTGEMWMNLRYDLAKTDVFKGFAAASNARIYDALDFLNKEARDAEERKHREQK